MPAWSERGSPHPESGEGAEVLGAEGDHRGFGFRDRGPSHGGVRFGGVGRRTVLEMVSAEASARVRGPGLADLLEAALRPLARIDHRFRQNPVKRCVH